MFLLIHRCSRCHEVHHSPVWRIGWEYTHLWRTEEMPVSNRWRRTQTTAYSAHYIPYNLQRCSFWHKTHWRLKRDADSIYASDNVQRNSSPTNYNCKKISSPSDHPRYSLFLHQVCRNVSQQWMLCSEWVPSEWESDKNITIKHTTPVHLEKTKALYVHIFLELFWLVNGAWSVQISLLIHTRTPFSLEEDLLGIMDFS